MEEIPRPQYDPYYRDFPSNALPARTPFTRSGRNDAGYIFFYLTHKKPNWSLILEKSRMDYIYAEADMRIPRDFTQFLLLEKRYSTQTSQSRARRANHPRGSTPPQQEAQNKANDPSAYSFSNTLIVLREPDPILTKHSDIVSYHLEEDEAVAAADAYTRQNNRRALVGLLLWDERWY
jgi:hypothetical protein